MSINNNNPQHGGPSVTIEISNIQGGIHGLQVAGRDLHVNQLVVSPLFIRARERLLFQIRARWLTTLEPMEIPLALDVIPQDTERVGLEAFCCEVPQVPPVELFYALDESIVLVGSAGAGKTRVLLQIVSGLVIRAESDPAQQIPIFLNLCSWSKAKHKNLESWLKQEMKRGYQIPGSFSQELIKSSSLLVILDGLDELRASERNACVQAINSFVERHSPAILIACRDEEFSALTTRVLVAAQVRIRSLDRERLETYLENGGSSTAHALVQIRSDVRIVPILDTPFMLRIFLYWSNMGRNTSVAVTKDGFLDYYIDSKLQPSSELSRMKSLAILGRMLQIMQHNNTYDFLVEDLQPYHLQSRVARWGHTLLTATLLTVVLIAMSESSRLVLALVSGGVIPEFYAQESVYLLGAYIPIFAIVVRGRPIEPVPRISWSWKDSVSNMSVALAILFILGIIYSAATLPWGQLALVCLITALMVFGLRGFRKEASLPAIVYPNEILVRSAVNSISFLAVGVVLLVAVHLISGFTWLGSSLLAWVLFWSASRFGGLAALQNISVRIMLALEQSLPLSLLTTLRRSGLFQQVGGAFIVKHDLIRERICIQAADLCPPIRMEIIHHYQDCGGIMGLKFRDARLGAILILAIIIKITPPEGAAIWTFDDGLFVAFVLTEVVAIPFQVYLNNPKSQKSTWRFSFWIAVLLVSVQLVSLCGSISQRN